MIEVTRGSTYYEEFRLVENGEPLDCSNAKQVEFAFAETIECDPMPLFTKTYPSQDVKYDAETKVFTILLSEQETYQCCDKLYVQAKITWRNDLSTQTKILRGHINPTLFKVEETVE